MYKTKTSLGDFYQSELIHMFKYQTFPEGLKVLSDLDLSGCDSLMELPADIKVGGSIRVSQEFINKYPFRDIPKVLHLPFVENIKRALIERLQNGY